ncbi:MAG: hypothetical protein AAGJ28_06750 [Pseudomonadota bacterium]
MDFFLRGHRWLLSALAVAIVLKAGLNAFDRSDDDHAHGMLRTRFLFDGGYERFRFGDNVNTFKYEKNIDQFARMKPGAYIHASQKRLNKALQDFPTVEHCLAGEREPNGYDINWRRMENAEAAEVCIFRVFEILGNADAAAQWSTEQGFRTPQECKPADGPTEGSLPRGSSLTRFLARGSSGETPDIPMKSKLGDRIPTDHIRLQWPCLMFGRGLGYPESVISDAGRDEWIEVRAHWDADTGNLIYVAVSYYDILDHVRSSARVFTIE